MAPPVARRRPRYFGGQAARSTSAPDRRAIEQLRQELLRGPTAHGYRTELWTLQRIAQLIKKMFAVSYHPGHVFKVLQAMDWSCQKPQRRARERNEARIQQWVEEDWLRLKKGP